MKLYPGLLDYRRLGGVYSIIVGFGVFIRLLLVRAAKTLQADAIVGGNPAFCGRVASSLSHHSVRGTQPLDNCGGSSLSSAGNCSSIVDGAFLSFLPTTTGMHAAM